MIPITDLLHIAIEYSTQRAGSHFYTKKDIFRVSTDYLLGIEHKQELDLSGLSKAEIDALLELVKAMKQKY